MTTFADHLKSAEFNFLSEVATALNAQQKYVEATVKKGISMSFLEYKGTDRSDLSLEGTASIAMTSPYEATVHVMYQSAYRGNGSDEVKLRTGELNVDTVVRMIERNIGY